MHSAWDSERFPESLLRWGAGRFVQLGKTCGFEAWCFWWAVKTVKVEKRKIMETILNMYEGRKKHPYIAVNSENVLPSQRALVMQSHWAFMFEEFNYHDCSVYGSFMDSSTSSTIMPSCSIELEHFSRVVEEQWFDHEGLQTQWGRRQSCMHVAWRPDPDIVGTGRRQSEHK